MLVSYVDRCAVCACSSLRDEGGRRPVPGLAACSEGCACHDSAPASVMRSARASASAMSNDAVRFRLWRRARRTSSLAPSAAR